MHRSLLIVVAALGTFSAAPLAAQTPPPPAAPARRVVVPDITTPIGCAPQAASTPPAATIRVIGGQEAKKYLYAANDGLVIGAGSAQGLAVGQEYFVRRVVPDRFTVPLSDGTSPISIHTAGWVRIVDVQTNAAIGIVTNACDGIMEGDYLEPFTPPAKPAAPIAAGTPDYANPAHIILGDERRQAGGQGSLMVIDRGSDHGLKAGQRLTVYRNSGGGTVFRVGDAAVVTVHPETSLVRILASHDAIFVGDLIAIHR
jgi:hypothetical protein